MNTVMVQRWISDHHRDIFQNFLKPVCEGTRTWLIYEIDDAMHYEEIPLFNRGRPAFANPKTQDNIKYMLNAADLVIVTTTHIKGYYHSKYGVPLENIVAVPNLLPRWWFGDRYDPERSVELFRKNKNKPRIGIVSSLSHYNVSGTRISPDGKACNVHKEKDGTEVWKDQDGNVVDFQITQPITDDLDEILDTIIQTMDDVQWVFFGYTPPKLEKYIKAKKIECHGGVPILNYPSRFQSLNLQMVVAPIKDMEFNLCKSHIKFLECCALGIPLLASRLVPYDGTVPDKFLFSSGDELKSKILEMKFVSAGVYRNIIETNWKWLNSSKPDGDYVIRNGWLEDNMDIWMQIFKMRQKGPKISLKDFLRKMDETRSKNDQNVIYHGDNGVEILK